MNENKNDCASRIIYLDYLRVISTIAVIIIHTCASNWLSVNVNGTEWRAFCMVDSAVRWAVPIFFMISGTLFLNRDITINKLWTKYIRKMMLVFVTWSGFYISFIDGDISSKCKEFFLGHYHMWFIWAIIGIYICMPFIKKIIELDSYTYYYLTLSFIFAFLIPELFIMVNDFGSNDLIEIANSINISVYNMNMHMVLGFASYYILGYYLSKAKFRLASRIIIYIMGLVSFILTYKLNYTVAIKNQYASENYLGYFTVNVLIEAVAIYILFKHINFNNKYINKIIEVISKHSFGIYLIHTFCLEKLNSSFGINTLSYSSVLIAIPIVVIIVFTESFLISLVLNKIPILNKYIV